MARAAPYLLSGHFMPAYSTQLIVSIAIRFAAIVLSVVLLRRVKDWRIGLLTFMLSLMFIQQLLRLSDVKSEIPGTIVSVLALLVTAFVGRLILAQKAHRDELAGMNERLEATVADRTAALEKSNRELTHALSQVKTLSGLLPICASCKKVRDDTGYWEQIEKYIINRSDAVFSHGICPECLKRLYPGIVNDDEAERHATER
jgi:nitrate/nitrite-specific signal transduction histidine kinase